MIDPSEKDKPNGSSELPQLDPPPSRTELRLLAILRVTPFGVITIKMHNGKPAMIERMTEKIRLDD